MFNYSETQNYLLLVFSIFLQLFNGTMGNMYSKKFISGNRDRFLYSIKTQSSAAAILFVLSGFSLKCSAYTVMLAILFGVITSLQSVLALSALAIGPWSYTSVIGSLSTVITAFSGCLFWQEKISVVRFIGIFLMIACIILAVSKKENDKKTSLRWLLFSVLSALCVACVGLLQKVYQNSSYKQELSQFLIIAFLVAVIFSSIFYVWLTVKNKSEESKERAKSSARKRALLLAGMIAAGVCIALTNKFNLYLSGAMDSSVFFPIVNGGGLILSIVVSVIFFKEKLSKIQWVGIFTGIVATMLLCI